MKYLSSGDLAAKVLMGLQGTAYGRVQFCPVGVFTIVEVKSSKGDFDWGRLKSWIGWIRLDFTKRV